MLGLGGLASTESQWNMAQNIESGRLIEAILVFTVAEWVALAACAFLNGEGLARSSDRSPRERMPNSSCESNVQSIVSQLPGGSSSGGAAFRLSSEKLNAPIGSDVSPSVARSARISPMTLANL